MKSSSQIPDALRKQAVDWWFMTQSEHCTDQDRQALAAWLAESPSHQHAYQTVQSHWQILQPLKDKHFPARDASLRYRPKARPSLVCPFAR